MTLWFCSVAFFPQSFLYFNFLIIILSLVIFIHLFLPSLFSPPHSNSSLLLSHFHHILALNVPFYSLRLSHRDIRTHPFKISFWKCCVLQSSAFPRVQQSSHQADYALSVNLSALFVPLDHTASSQTNPAFVRGFLICSDQNCTFQHECLQGGRENTVTPFASLYGYLELWSAFVFACDKQIPALFWLVFNRWKLLSPGFLLMLISSLLFIIVWSKRCVQAEAELCCPLWLVINGFLLAPFSRLCGVVVLVASRGHCKQTYLRYLLYVRYVSRLKLFQTLIFKLLGEIQPVENLMGEHDKYDAVRVKCLN